MSRNSLRLLVALLSFAIGLLIFAGVALVVRERTGAPLVASSSIGAPFRLIDQNGQVVTEAALKEKPHLVFFGFTHCPDICPTTLFEISEVMKALGPDADRAGAMFITVDPERDTPQALKDYLEAFDPHLRALTGDPQAVAAAERAFRAYSKKVPLEGGGYTMDHSTIVYLMDKEGRFVNRFNMKQTPEQAAAELRRYL